MRYLLLFAFVVLLLLTVLLAREAQAANWVRVVDIQAGMVRGFELQSSCAQGGAFVCLEIGNERPNEITINDLGDGNYSFSVNTAAKDARLAAEAKLATNAARLSVLAGIDALSTAEVEEAVNLLLNPAR